MSLPTHFTGSTSVHKNSIPSPVFTVLPRLSAAEKANLPYPPYIFPGARDVDTFYGTMRVYEWGPETGKKVICLHGDATSAPIYAKIAQGLVENGCRVMIFDLWGRGYTSTPLDVPHDARLFGLQILFAATSSPLSWTGAASGGFSIIAFSLGGGIAMEFAGTFPHLVNDLVLLGPAGLLRSLPDSYIALKAESDETKFRRLVADCVEVEQSSSPSRDVLTPASDVTEAENPVDLHNFEFDGAKIVHWQYDNHAGFEYSFPSTVKYGPIMGQHDVWAKTCDIIRGQRCSGTRLHGSRMLVVFGDDDNVVVGVEVQEDLTSMLGGLEHVTFKYVPGGHGFPYPNSKSIVDFIAEHWDLGIA